VKSSKPKCPWSLKFFAAWIALLGMIGLTRAFVLFQPLPLPLQGLPLNWTMIILSVMWGLGLLASAVGLWFRWEPARRAALFLVPAYYLTHWLSLIFFTRASYGRAQIGPYTIFVLLVIAYSTWFLVRRATRRQFQNHEQGSSGSGN